MRPTVSEAVYGCSNFRKEVKCDFRIWQRPFADPCPKCKAPFLVRGGTNAEPTLRCMTEDCGYDKPYEEAEESDESDTAVAAGGGGS